MECAHACQTWQLPTACHTAERMGSMPLHNLTTVRSATCQSRQVICRRGGVWHGVRTRLPNMAATHRLPHGRADGIYAAAQSHDCEIGHLPMLASSILPDSRRGGIWRLGARRLPYTAQLPTACHKAECLPQGEAEWDIGERMSLRRRDGAEMVQPPKTAGDIPPASS